jgi:hypothetical protein
MNEPDRDLTDDDTAPLPPISDELSPAAFMPVQSHTTEFLLASVSRVRDDGTHSAPLVCRMLERQMRSR